MYEPIALWAGFAVLLFLCVPFSGTRKLVLEVYGWALRLALVLRHYEGMSFEEIARLTGAPASTVKSRFAAALARLRERLKELG